MRVFSLVILALLSSARVASAEPSKEISRLGSQLRSDNPAATRRAERRLEKLRSEDAYDQLVSFALEHLLAGKGFGAGGDLLARIGPPAIPAIVRAYPNQSDQVKWGIIELAPDWGPVSAPLINLAIAESNHRRQGLAAWAIGRARLPHARERLIELLKSPDPLIQEGAISGLRVLHDPVAIEPLVEVLEAPNAEIPREQPIYLAPTDLHGCALQAINVISGQHFEGDVEEIRQWMKKTGGGKRKTR